MKRIVFLFVLFVITFSKFSHAQLNKANKYYNDLEYAKAIPLYEKIIKKNSTIEVLEKLAHSYFKVKNYILAERYYAELVKKENIQPINYFYYGLVLKNNNKVDEAKEQFQIYSSKVPEDKLAQVSLRSCDDIKIWMSQSKQYEVKTLENINSAYSDFCPVFYGNKMVFVSERTQDLVNYEDYSWNKRSFLNVYYTPEIKDSIVFSKKVSAFMSSINTAYHDGPICFNADQTVMYITRVDNSFISFDSNSYSRPQLYTSVHKKGEQWYSTKPFKYNNPAYSLAHPTISADGKRLFFSSDMPGGKGGMDLYVCEREGLEWGQPKNLGDSVNTFLDEVFPYIRKDDVLFFSSEGHSGFGGLDIFSSQLKNGVYVNVKNVGTPINSYTDDFGIVFSKSSSKGYFSSDRTGGKGYDDIYYFEAVNTFIAVQGKILYNKNVNDPVKNAEVILVNEKGEVVKVSTTDENGFFIFENLDPEQKYMVKMDADDPKFNGKNKLYMTDGKNNFVRVTVIDDKGNKFTFTNLPEDENQMPQLGVDDDISIAGNILFGDDSKPLMNKKINLVNERGVVVATTTTNALGAFVFTKLPNDENFMVQLDETDGSLTPGTKITITNKKGEAIQTSKVGEDSKFKFMLLKSDTTGGLSLMVVEDVELRFNFKGKLVSEKNVPLANSTVNLINDKGDVLKTTKTNDKGELMFADIDYAQDILISIDENDSLYKTFEQLFFLDEHGNVIRAFTKLNGLLRFALLPDEKSRMGYVYLEDKWLKITPSIAEKNNPVIQGSVYLDSKKTQAAKNVTAQLLSENGEILKTQKTDDKGFFIFENLDPDKKYMVVMDEKDVQLKDKAKLYLADAKGEIVRVTVVDNEGRRFIFKNLPLDESQPPLVLSEDDVSIAGNLLYADNPSLPLTNTKLKLVNEKGETVQTTTTNALGAFVFAKLPNDENYMIVVDEIDGTLAPGTKIIITNKKGQQLQTTKVGVDKSFKFSLLANDITKGLSVMEVDDAELRFNFKGKLVSEKKVPLSNSVVNLVNENGDVLQSTKTNENGELKFTDIDYAQDILITIDENDSLFKTFQQLFFMDEGGKIIRAFTKMNGKLRFAILPDEKFKMGYIHVDDPWLKVIELKAEAKNDTITIEENIYYDFDKYDILPEAKMVLDKIVNIMKNDKQLIVELYSHTDSRSTLEYNLKLSQKRANTAVAYIVSKGIAKERISGKGFGESEIINKCQDDVECTEEEHAQNRRTEFYVKRK